jgi:type I restriction enzyme S subunit
LNQNNWPRLRLEDVSLQITDGEHQTPKRCASGKKLLSARNIQMGQIVTDDVDYVGDGEFARISKRCAPVRGDVLVSCSGTIGRVAIVDTNEPLCLVRSVAMVRPDQRRLIPEYLASYLRTPFMQEKMRRATNASGQPNLFQGPIRQLPMLLPPIEIQAKIREALNGLVAMRDRYRAHLEKLDALFASLQHRAFRGELTGAAARAMLEKIA